MRAGASVFLAGVGVMAAEILASRLLAPTFGASLTTWSVLIATTLLLGSLGAWFGGAWAERHPGGGSTAAFLVAAAGFALATTGLAGRIGGGLASLPIGALLTSLVLLAPIVAPLAAVLPLAGATAARGGVSPRLLGRLVALSTAGSLVGTLGAALVLVPDVGLRGSFLALAALCAVAAGTQARRGAARAAALGLAVLAVAGLALGRGATTSPHARETAYGRVEVRRGERGAQLLVDGILQGARSPFAAGRGALLRARQHVELLPFLHPRGRRALQVGLGAGIVPRVLEAYGVAVESIDVNPDLVDIARTVFGYDGAVRIGDGRVLLRRTTEPVDFVILDAFQGEVLPAHLVTHEAFAEVRARLGPGGILCVHLIGRPAHAVTEAVAATLRSVFEHQLATRAGVGDELQDIYLFASAAPLRLQPHPELAAAGWIGNEVFRPRPGGVVLTDDRNPLERLNEPLARALRSASR